MLATHMSCGVLATILNRMGEHCVHASTLSIRCIVTNSHNDAWHTPHTLVSEHDTQFPSHGMGWPGRRYIHFHLPSESQHRVGIEPWPPARKSRTMTTALLRPYTYTPLLSYLEKRSSLSCSRSRENGFNPLAPGVAVPHGGVQVTKPEPNVPADGV